MHSGEYDHIKSESVRKQKALAEPRAFFIASVDKVFLLPAAHLGQIVNISNTINSSSHTSFGAECYEYNTSIFLAGGVEPIS